jgi:predicted amidohydrolase
MSNIADDFCAGYDRLDEELLVNRGLRWRSQPTFRRHAGAVCAAVEAGEDIDWPAHTASTAAQRQLYATLKGLDWAFRRINPLWMGRHVPAALAEPRRSFRKHGRLSSAAAHGALVPKLSSAVPQAERPQTLDRAFEYVQRATPEQCQHVERVITRDGQWLAADERARGLTIGCVAFIDSQDEINVTVVKRDKAAHYRITLKDHEPWARTRVNELIELFDVSGVQLAVIPEMALTADLLEHWSNELGNRDIPRSSNLRWVLAGTGNVQRRDPPRNTGVLLDAKTGEVIVEQSKQFRFDLAPEQQAGAYAFKAFGSAPTQTLYEDIDITRTMRLVELGSMRLAILICEDIGHFSELLAKVHHNGVSHVLTPVFAQHMRYWRWEQQAAEAFAKAQGTVVTVANSLVLGRMNGRPPPIPSSLVHTPWGWRVQQVEGPCGNMRAIVRDGERPDALDDVAPDDPAGL